MKNYLILSALCLFTHLSIAQTSNDAENSSTYIEVVNVDSVSAETLYSRAKMFVANEFNSATDVTKLDAPTTMTLIIKARLPRNYTNPFNHAFGGAVRFRFVIQCKDGRYKYVLDELVHEDKQPAGDYSGGSLANEKPACGGLFMTKKGWAKIKADTVSHLKKFVSDLEVAMRTDDAFNDNNRW